MGEGGLRIQTTAEADARCIADALDEYGAKVEVGTNDNWHVKLSDPGPTYPVLLQALQACLDLHCISSVQVVLGDQTYLMEGAETPQAP